MNGLYKYDIKISEDDIESLVNNSEYEKFYNKVIKRNKMESGEEVNLENKLLQQIIEVKVLLLEDVEIEDIEIKDYQDLSDNILRDYLIYISRFRVLTREEEQDLFKRYLSGDQEAKEEIVNHNLKLVVHIVKKKRRLHGFNLEMMDYIL